MACVFDLDGVDSIGGDVDKYGVRTSVQSIVNELFNNGDGVDYDLGCTDSSHCRRREYGDAGALVWLLLICHLSRASEIARRGGREGTKRESREILHPSYWSGGACLDRAFSIACSPRTRPERALLASARDLCIDNRDTEIPIMPLRIVLLTAIREQASVCGTKLQVRMT